MNKLFCAFCCALSVLALSCISVDVDVDSESYPADGTDAGVDAPNPGSCRVSDEATFLDTHNTVCSRPPLTVRCTDIFTTDSASIAVKMLNDISIQFVPKIAVVFYETGDPNEPYMACAVYEGAEK